MHYIEYFDYEENVNKAENVIGFLTPILVLLFCMAILSMICFFQRKQYHLMIATFFCLICPFFITQIVCFFLCLVVLSLYSFRISKKPLPIFLLLFSFFIYGFTCYVIMSLSLYFFASLTVWDLQNSNLFHENFVSYDTLVKMKILDKKHQKDFLSSLSKGKQDASTKKIVFCFLSKNSENHIPFMRQKLKTMGSFFDNYHVVGFENDSSDNSRKLFNLWAKTDDHFTILDCCSLGNCDCKLKWKDNKDNKGMISTSRINRMRKMREYVLNYIQKHFADWDYMVFLDFDLGGAIFLDGFFTTFARNDWDMVFGAGFTSTPILNFLALYDGIAYVGESQENVYQSKNEMKKCIHDLSKMNKDLNHFPCALEWTKCKSGFNGMAVYRMKSILDATYMNTNFPCEHVDLHFDMTKNGFHKIYYNPQMILFVGHQGPQREDILKNIFQ